MNNTNVSISKSKYLAGMQCHKLLWYYYNDNSVFPETDAATQALFDQGHLVGEYAKRLYPNGIEIGWDIQLEEVVERTQEKLQERKPLFEAGFLYQNGYARVDILEPVSSDQWDIIEVKSSTSCKDEHIVDVAFQKYVCQNAGITINQCYLLLIDTSYTRYGEIEPQKLFKKVEITEKVDTILPQISDTLTMMLAIIHLPQEPDIKIGSQCSKPNPCPLQERCWSFLPERNVFCLYRGGNKIPELFNRNILAIKDIPADFPLNHNQQIQVKSEKSGQPHIEPKSIQDFIDQLVYPLYFLDFETYNPAIPLHDNSSPYEKIPFQYSLHLVSHPGGNPEHFSYLADGRADPRPEILARLKQELGDYGSILVYNVSFESQILTNCAKRFPEYQPWVESIIPRFVDLLKPFQSFAYYHPNQNGSASLKSVMPALIGKGYDDMEISDGEEAGREFLRVTYTEVTPEEQTRVRTALARYCNQDTEGLMGILIALNNLISNKSESQK
ncbi:MAG: DUF2779 domain-containing protein [bacterium]|nr:DUF2779 domain-containing protein [bacterium]